MTLYEKFKNLHIDFSSLGLEQGGSRSDYFCTPKGAKVIGWEGVDGIHYCFVKGFGEVVFAVNPSNLPGDYVHPLARSFEDFLRLLMACKGLAAVAAVVNPEVFVIGGGVSKAGEILFDYIRPAYEKYVFHGCRNARFALATLGNDAGIFGAAGLIINE